MTQQIEISTPLWQLIISVIAIILAPIVALRISKILEVNKNKEDRKLYIFQTLMMTRAAKLSQEHIRALNMIDVEFYGNKKKNSDVVEAWKVYLDNLNDIKYRDDNLSGWDVKNKDLFADLMQKMAICLNYKFDKSIIVKTSYYPEGHVTIDNDLSQIRGELAKIVSGKKALPIVIMNPIEDKKE